ncbi:hypothetical protein ACFOU2_00585 [Bacillus songklensis]|uniref:Uncharacterized protein n=1 Tax=Bacillus songklensis TaxID=1069116 RepID=A0ABV8AWZ5_9BACI
MKLPKMRELPVHRRASEGVATGCCALRFSSRVDGWLKQAGSYGQLFSS